jgi:hypothetical protein
LKISQDLIAQAEKELNENRYDTDIARDLAKKANYEAKHAIYLTETIRSMQKNKRSWENQYCYTKLNEVGVKSKYTSRKAHFPLSPASHHLSNP